MLEQYILLWCGLLMIMAIAGMKYPFVSVVGLFMSILTLVISGSVTETSDTFLRTVEVGVILLNAITSILGGFLNWIK